LFIFITPGNITQHSLDCLPTRAK